MEVKMTVRTQDLERLGEVCGSFAVHQTTGVDDLKDADKGKAVKLTGNNEVGPATDGSIFLGKLIDLTLTDADVGKRIATVQITGIMTVPITTTYPVIGNRIIGGASGTVKQAPVLTGYDPAGGNIAGGRVIAVNGTTECTLLM
jgi:hypothetical protein